MTKTREKQSAWRETKIVREKHKSLPTESTAIRGEWPREGGGKRKKKLKNFFRRSSGAGDERDYVDTRVRTCAGDRVGRTTAHPVLPAWTAREYGANPPARSRAFGGQSVPPFRFFPFFCHISLTGSTQAPGPAAGRSPRPRVGRGPVWPRSVRVSSVVRRTAG